MKFKNYLNEVITDGSDYNNMVQVLKNSCSPFLKEFKDTKRLIWRGYNKGINQRMYARKPTRKDRKPRFIDKMLHDALGEFLKNKFGWNAREEGVFTGDLRTADAFGNNIYLFFPVGKYKYIWCNENEKDNLYSEYDNFGHGYSDGWTEDKVENAKRYKKFMQEQSNSIIDMADNYYEDKGLNKYLNNNKNEFEAIFKCDSFYLVDSKALVKTDNDVYSVEELIVGDLF